MSTAVEVRYTPEQYLALERKAEFKSEYIDGEIHPMPGVSRWHSFIVGCLYRVISTFLLDRAGEIHASDMRVHVGPAGLFTYPDIVIVAGEGRAYEDVEARRAHPRGLPPRMVGVRRPRRPLPPPV